MAPWLCCGQCGSCKKQNSSKMQRREPHAPLLSPFHRSSRLFFALHSPLPRALTYYLALFSSVCLYGHSWLHCIGGQRVQVSTGGGGGLRVRAMHFQANHQGVRPSGVLLARGPSLSVAWQAERCAITLCCMKELGCCRGITVAGALVHGGCYCNACLAQRLSSYLPLILFFFFFFHF